MAGKKTLIKQIENLYERLMKFSLCQQAINWQRVLQKPLEEQSSYWTLYAMRALVYKFNTGSDHTSILFAAQLLALARFSLRENELDKAEKRINKAEQLLTGSDQVDDS